MGTAGRGAAAYSNQIVVQQNVPTDDGSGQPVDNYVDQFVTWANIVPKGGKQTWMFQQLRADITHIVRLRYSAQSKQVFPGAWRFRTEDGSLLNVQSRINVDSRNFEFEFSCIEAQIPS